MTDGDFTPHTQDLLNRAETLCRRRGAQLTELRRQVLGLVLDSPEPSGAYELLDRLRARRGHLAPPTIYRALDFLIGQRLIHKVERLAAFVGCVHEAGDADEPEHPAQFLICTNCHGVTELTDPEIGEALAHAAERSGFALGAAVIEAVGICAACVERQ